MGRPPLADPRVPFSSKVPREIRGMRDVYAARHGVPIADVRRALLAVACVVAVAMSQTAKAEDADPQTGVFAGLQSVSVTVSVADAEGKPTVELSGKLQERVAARLRDSGLNVLEPQARPQGHLFLKVEVLAAQCGLQGITADLNLLQEIRIVRNNLPSIGSTWSTSGRSGSRSGEYGPAIETLVDRMAGDFVAAHRKWNPKK